MGATSITGKGSGADEHKNLVEFERLGKKIDENLSEYKKFAFKGHIFDMACAFILGAAFTKVVTALSENILMPIVGWFLKIVGSSWRDAVWTPLVGLTLETGKFFGSFVDFMLVSIFLFVIWKLLHKAEDRLHAKRRSES